MVVLHLHNDLIVFLVYIVCTCKLYPSSNGFSLCALVNYFTVSNGFALCVLVNYFTVSNGFLVVCTCNLPSG